MLGIIIIIVHFTFTISICCINMLILLLSFHHLIGGLVVILPKDKAQAFCEDIEVEHLHY